MEDANTHEGRLALIEKLKQELASIQNVEFRRSREREIHYFEDFDRAKECIKGLHSVAAKLHLEKALTAYAQEYFAETAELIKKKLN